MERKIDKYFQLFKNYTTINIVQVKVEKFEFENVDKSGSCSREKARLFFINSLRYSYIQK